MKICKLINFAIINLVIQSFLLYIFDVTFLEFYILITIIIIRLTSLVYSKQFNSCTCYVDRIRFEREIDSTRIWTRSKSRRKLYFIQLNIAIQTDCIILLSNIVQFRKRARAWKTKSNKNKLFSYNESTHVISIIRSRWRL